MRPALYWVAIILDVIALGASLVWFYTTPSAEPFVSVLALSSTLVALIYSKRRKSAASGGANSVNQIGNEVRGDMAGRDIKKSSGER